MVAIDDFFIGKVLVRTENHFTRLGVDGAVAAALVLPEFLEGLGGIDELNLIYVVPLLLVGDEPDVSGDAGVVEDVVRQLNDGFHQIAFHQVAADIAFTTAGVSCEEGGTVVDGCNAASLRLELDGFHLVHLFQDEEELAVGGAWCAVQDLGLTGEVQKREAVAVVQQILLVVYLLLVLLPGFTVWRIGEHEAEGLVGKVILGNGVAQMDA